MDGDILEGKKRSKMVNLPSNIIVFYPHFNGLPLTASLCRPNACGRSSCCAGVKPVLTWLLCSIEFPYPIAFSALVAGDEVRQLGGAGTSLFRFHRPWGKQTNCRANVPVERER